MSFSQPALSMFIMLIWSDFKILQDHVQLEFIKLRRYLDYCVQGVKLDKYFTKNVQFGELL